MNDQEFMNQFTDEQKPSVIAALEFQKGLEISQYCSRCNSKITGEILFNYAGNPNVWETKCSCGFSNQVMRGL